MHNIKLNELLSCGGSLKMRVRHIYFVLISIIIFTLIGCDVLTKKETNDEVHIDFTEKNIEVYETEAYETGFNIGKEAKKIVNNSEFEKPAIRVNKQFINMDKIEYARINAKYTKYDDIRENILTVIKMEVLRQEAVRLGVEPIPNEVDEEVMRIEQGLRERQNPFLNGYLDGMDMSVEEYLLEVKETTYLTKQRGKLLEMVMKDFKDKITKEAERRKIPYSEVEKKYYDKYTANLIKKAQIEYVDPNVKQLMGY